METIKRRFPLNKNPGLTNGNEHWLHRPDPSQVTSAYCTFKQATEKRLLRKTTNFLKWKGTFRSERPK